jgi:ElaB/YqjD/DUF883 family membrane-anchored ribosome-binding protein
METHFPFTESSDMGTRTAQLSSDLKVVVRDIEELLKTAAGQLNEKTAGHLVNVLDRAKSLGRQLEHGASVGLRQADQVIRQHPYQSLGIAFAIGTLIGVLVNRR